MTLLSAHSIRTGTTVLAAITLAIAVVATGRAVAGSDTPLGSAPDAPAIAAP